MSLHKYLYAGGDPIDFGDPSGESLLSVTLSLSTSFSFQAVAFRAVLGAALGAIDYSLNDDPNASLISSMAWGAGTFVLGPKIPWQVGIPLAGAGLWDAAARGDIDLLLFRGATILSGFGLYRYLSTAAAPGALGNFQTRTMNVGAN